MTSPFSGLPDDCFWRRYIGGGLRAKKPLFRLNPQEKIMTAGSCFARRVAAYLMSQGCNVLIKEDLHPLFYNIESHTFAFDQKHFASQRDRLREKYNYGIFTCRYDDMYHSGHLNQILKRAFGYFTPQEDIWLRSDGKFVDAFRAKINPDGYASRQELIQDRKYHLKCVQEAFTEMNTLIFTFGLTEAWKSKIDGAYYPIAPGVVAGSFDPSSHEFVNLTVSEIVREFQEFSRLLRKINPKSKIILTVSPTPIIATAQADWNVLEASFYAKSALRAACEEIRQTVPLVSYFPSYEMVMAGVFKGDNNFCEDVRTPSPEAIKLVMEHFLNSYFEGSSQGVVQERKAPPQQSTFAKLLEECDNILE
jgi:hypothetical protein